MWEVLVEIRPLPQIRDPEGNTIAKASRTLGHREIKKVVVSKGIRLYLDVDTDQEALNSAKELAEKLLVNPVLNYAEISIIGLIQEIEDPARK